MSVIIDTYVNIFYTMDIKINLFLTTKQKEADNGLDTHHAWQGLRKGANPLPGMREGRDLRAERAETV